MEKSTQKEVKRLMLLINDMFYKKFISKNTDKIDELYESAIDHLEIKLFELQIEDREKNEVRKAVNQLIEKHLLIFHKVHILNEDLNTVLCEVIGRNK